MHARSLGTNGHQRRGHAASVARGSDLCAVKVTACRHFSSGASRDRTGDLLLAKQIGLSTRVSWCRVNAWKCGSSVGHGRTRKDGAGQTGAPLVAPRRSCLGAAGRGRSAACPASSARGCGRGQGRSCVGDRRMGVEPWHILELVHHVAIGAERESRVVAELAGDVANRATLMEQQRRERMPEVVGTPVLQTRRLDRAPEGPPAPRLVCRERLPAPFLVTTWGAGSLAHRRAKPQVRRGCTGAQRWTPSPPIRPHFGPHFGPPVRPHLFAVRRSGLRVNWDEKGGRTAASPRTPDTSGSTCAGLARWTSLA